MRVWLKFERTFSMCSSPALKCSVSSTNVFVSSVKCVCKVFVSSTINAIGFYLDVGLEPPPPSTKEQKKGRKSFCKTSFQVGMNPKKVQKQGRNERTRENYPTPTVYFFFTNVGWSSHILSSQPCCRTFFGSIPT